MRLCRMPCRSCASIPRPVTGSADAPVVRSTIGWPAPGRAALATDPDMALSASYQRCPVCGSWDVERRSEMGRVWFVCRRCGNPF